MTIKNFNEFLIENRIGIVKDTVSIEVVLNTTLHAEERKYRHDDTVITDEEIMSVVKKALEEIADHQLKGIDDIGCKYWIYDKATKDLNVVGQLIRTRDDKLVFKIITVMFEKQFRATPDAIKITV